MPTEVFARHLTPYLAGEAVPETRSFEEREAPCQAWPTPTCAGGWTPKRSSCACGWTRYLQASLMRSSPGRAGNGGGQVLAAPTLRVRHPPVVVQTAVFGALVTGLGLTEDLKAGVVDRFRSLPIARSAVLLGRTAADMVMNIMTLIVMVLVGLAVGFRPSRPFYDLALAFVLVLAFSYVFSWISAFVGLSVRDPDTAQSAGFIWVFPLTFASSAFVPTSSMPGVVRTLAQVNPVSLAVNAVRALTVRHAPALTPALETLAWLTGLLLIFIPLAVRAFRRA